MDKLKLVEQSLMADNLPDFTFGDTINIHYRVKEGEKERIQQYEGVVIGISGSGPNRTMTVRKMSGNIGVERIFPINLPALQKVEINKRGKVRQSRIYYFRELTGKKARIKERRFK